MQYEGQASRPSNQDRKTQCQVRVRISYPCQPGKQVSLAPSENRWTPSAPSEFPSTSPEAQCGLLSTQTPALGFHRAPITALAGSAPEAGATSHTGRRGQQATAETAVTADLCLPDLGWPNLQATTALLCPNRLPITPCKVSPPLLSGASGCSDRLQRVLDRHALEKPGWRLRHLFVI